MKNIISIILIIFLAIAFSFFNYFSGKYHKVLRVDTPFNIVVDINNNGRVDSGEEIKLSKMKILTFTDKELCLEVANKNNVDYETVLGVGYLADKFAEDNLLGKTVRYENNNGIVNIWVNNFNYVDRVFNTGFVLKDEKPINNIKFNELLKYAKSQNYKIYNLKSHKYHNLSCKYGLRAKNSVVISLKQLPSVANPCKFCFKNKSIKNDSIEIKKDYLKLVPPLTLFTTKNLKIFLNDYTTNLKTSKECRTGVCKELVSLINKSSDTIDIAIYGYDKVPAIDFALSNAIKRGVKIRLVYDIDSKGHNIYKDTDYITKLIHNSKSDIAIETVKNPVQYTNSLMHNKFYIFDSKVVVMGSANLSSTDMSGFNSNSVIMVNSPSVAKIYQKEFEQMYQGKFHNLKNRIDSKNDIIIDGSILSIYFSPQDNTIRNGLLPLINSSNKYIYIPTFLITDKSMAEALINAKKRGVDVKVIVDAVNAKSKSSKHQLLRDNGVLVKTENYAGKLHSKSMIVDDKYVVIGSMNFSNSGNTKNDENLIILKNSRAAIFYRKFFEYLWNRVYNFWLTHDVSAESIYSMGSCSDGIDNDFDGKIDMADEGCKKIK